MRSDTSSWIRLNWIRIGLFQLIPAEWFNSSEMIPPLSLYISNLSI